MCHGICEGIWLQYMSRELKVCLDSPILLQCDNKAAISIMKNPVHHDQTKHVEIDRHFIKEELEEGMVKLVYILSNQQIANILTKALPRVIFGNLKSKLSMIDIHNPG